MSTALDRPGRRGAESAGFDVPASVAMGPVALCALAEHVIRYQLPAPVNVSLPVAEGEELEVQVRWENVNDWLDSVHIDDRDTYVHDSSDILTYAVRLPDLGVRLALTALRPRTTSHLQVVRP